MPSLNLYQRVRARCEMTFAERHEYARAQLFCLALGDTAGLKRIRRGYRLRRRFPVWSFCMGHLAAYAMRRWR